MFWVDEISSFQFALLDTAWDILTVSFFHIFILFGKSNSALHPLTFRRYGHMLRYSPHKSVKLHSFIYKVKQCSAPFDFQKVRTHAPLLSA